MLKKIEHGPTYGIPEVDQERKSLVVALEQKGVRVSVVDQAINFQSYRDKHFAQSRADILACDDDKVFGKYLIQATTGLSVESSTGGPSPRRFVFGQLGRIFETLVKQAEERVNEEKGEVAARDTARTEELCRRVSRIDSRLAKVWQQLPTGTLLVVLTCAGDTPLVARLARMKDQSANGGPTWNPGLEEIFERENRDAQRGVMFCAIRGRGGGGEGEEEEEEE